MGAQPGNRNRERHGLRASRLPQGCGTIRNAVSQLRSSLEAAVVDVHGSTGVYQAALIQSACRHETRAMLLSRWLRRDESNLSTMERAQLLAQISSATDARDKCLERLKLDKPVDAWVQALYSSPPACDDAPQRDANGADDLEAEPANQTQQNASRE